jgi:putative NADH-flavin reductase
VRNPKKVPALSGVFASKGYVLDLQDLSSLLKGHDAVINSVPSFAVKS